MPDAKLDELEKEFTKTVAVAQEADELVTDIDRSLYGDEKAFVEYFSELDVTPEEAAEELEPETVEAGEPALPALAGA